MGSARIEMALGAAGRELLTMEQIAYSDTVTTDSAGHRTIDNTDIPRRIADILGLGPFPE